MSLQRSIALLLPVVLLAACGKSKTGSGGDADGGSKAPPVTLTLKDGCNPFATSDECLYPFPSGFFQKADSTSTTGVRMNYPEGIFGASSSNVTIDVAPYNTADGVPPISPILLHFAADVDLTNLPDPHHEVDSVAANAPIAIFDLDTGARVPFFAEMDQNRKMAYPNRYAFIIRPMAPMEMGHRHAVVITDQVKLAGGMALPVSPAFSALRDGTITTNQQLEQVRSDYESMFTFLAAHGYAREHLALAWDFMVASKDYLLGPVLSMRQTALSELGTTGLSYTISSVTMTQEGGELVEGNFEAPTFINSDLQFDWDEHHHPKQQATNNTYPFTLYIPSTALATGAQPVPLVVFGHGLFGTGRGYLDGTGSVPTVIHGMAEKSGVVLVATDWIGLSGTNDNIAVGIKVGTDINQLGSITDRLVQSLINNLALTKLVRGKLQQDPMVKPADHQLLDLSRTYYYGVSLGGIQGASFVSLSDDISRAVFAVPGCAWSTMFPRSSDWAPFVMLSDPSYPDPLQQLTILALMQARFDFDDGANLGRLLLHEPLPGTPAKTVLIQEAIGDSQVPNITTEILGRVIGVQELTPDYSEIFGLPLGMFPTTSSSLSQYYLTQDVDGHLPPDTNVYRSDDNGAHADLNLLPNVQQQIVNFVQTGQIVQYCQDSCDPM